MFWSKKSVCEKLQKEITDGLGVSDLVSEILINRGIDSLIKAQSFLHPKLALLSDPYQVPNLKRAVDRICTAIKKKEKILIVGDYDVDGISSTVMTMKILANFDLIANFVIPFRKSEGYGLSKEVLERGIEKSDCSLIIALDCGTNSWEEAEILQKNKIDLVVIDHHKSKGEIHPHCLIVNPHLSEIGSEWTNLCTAGLCFKLVHGIIKCKRENGDKNAFEISPKDFLSLAALGTLADMVPLKSENRIFAKYGLKHLRKRPTKGLEALMSVAKVDLRYPLDSEDIAFQMAPRLNACGRLDRPEVAAKLLLANDPSEASELALLTNKFNEERKQIESKLTKSAILQAEEKFSDKDAVVIKGKGEDWIPGIVGIIAGKLCNSLNKPTLVLAYDQGKYKGSGRGIESVNLVDALAHCEKFLDHWGGHPAAVGLTVDEKYIEEFTEAFLSYIEKENTGMKSEPSIIIDSFLTVDQINCQLLKEIEVLGPFGQDNPEPVFGLRDLVLKTKPKRVGCGEHFQFRISSEIDSIPGIAWNMRDRIPPLNQKIDLAFRIRWNRWKNQNGIQVVLTDWRLSEKS